MTANNRCRVRWAGGGLRKTLCQRARSPPRSRPRKCAVSSSIDVLVEARPLRRFLCIASGRLLGPVRSCGRSSAILDTIHPTLVGLLGNEIETELLANHTGKKAAHRMLLPIRYSHDRCDGSTSRLPQHCDDSGVFGIGSCGWSSGCRRRSLSRSGRVCLLRLSTARPHPLVASVHHSTP